MVRRLRMVHEPMDQSCGVGRRFREAGSAPLGRRKGKFVCLSLGKAFSNAVAGIELGDLPRIAIQSPCHLHRVALCGAVRAQRCGYSQYFQEEFIVTPSQPDILFRRMISQGCDHVAFAGWQGSVFEYRRAMSADFGHLCLGPARQSIAVRIHARTSAAVLLSS